MGSGWVQMMKRAGRKTALRQSTAYFTPPTLWVSK
jgi:hypothetical protein